MDIKENHHFQLKHIELKDANAFVEQHHRHHKQSQGHRFSLGCYEDNHLVGVAIVGRPVARNFDYTKVLEITRLCTDGTYNACSFLYSACKRAAKALGYERIITYILESEPGASLKASGYEFKYLTPPGGGGIVHLVREMIKHLLVKSKCGSAYCE